MTSDRRGPGQPRIGARTQVVIPDVILDAADREAAARGLTAGRGRSVVLRDWLEVGYRRHALAQETRGELRLVGAAAHAVRHG